MNKNNVCGACEGEHDCSAACASCHRSGSRLSCARSIPMPVGGFHHIGQHVESYYDLYHFIEQDVYVVDQCVADYVCVCDHGTPTVGPACPAPGAMSCEACDAKDCDRPPDDCYCLSPDKTSCQHCS